MWLQQYVKKIIISLWQWQAEKETIEKLEKEIEEMKREPSGVLAAAIITEGPKHEDKGTCHPYNMHKVSNAKPKADCYETLQLNQIFVDKIICHFQAIFLLQSMGQIFN